MNEYKANSFMNNFETYGSVNKCNACGLMSNYEANGLVNMDQCKCSANDLVSKCKVNNSNQV